MYVFFEVLESYIIIIEIRDGKYKLLLEVDFIK